MDPSNSPQGNAPTTQIISDLPTSQSTAVAGPLVQAAASVSPPTPISSSKGKEIGPISQEVANFVEVAGNDAIEKEPLPMEVASWMEKVNRDSSQNKPTEIVINESPTTPPSTSNSNPVFVLPLGEVEMNEGMKSGVNDSVRWLSEWCKRVMKKLSGQVTYQ